MTFVDFLFGVFSSLSANAIQSQGDKVFTQMDQNNLKKEIASYLEMQKDRNGLYSIDEEYDYEGLSEYVKSGLLEDTYTWLGEKNSERDSVEKAIIKKAQQSAKANKENSERIVKEIIQVILGFIEKHEYLLTPLPDRILHNQSTESVKSEIRKSESKVSDTLSKIDSKIDSLFQNDDDEKYDIEADIEKAREITLNQPLFPWTSESIRLKDVVKYKLFIEPCFGEGVSFNSLFCDNKDTYLAILGPAGAGKTMIFRYIFAFSHNADRYVLYLTAKEAIDAIEDGRLDKIDKSPCLNNNQHLLLIDSVDEAFYNNYKGYEKFIRKLKSLNHCRIWLGCRSDFYKTFFGENTSMAEKSINLLPWDQNQCSVFISSYANICNDNNLPQKIDAILGEEHADMKKNPFQLALVIYLASEQGKENEQRVLGIYDLYERFLKQWIRRESNRGSCSDKPGKITESLRKAAKSIYAENSWELDDVAQNNSAISSLLIQNETDESDNPIASAFFHRSLAAFILAQNIVECFKSSKHEEAKMLLSVKLKDDVTNFVGDKFRCLDKKQKSIIKSNLEAMYYKYPEERGNLSFHEQIIYFITRMNVNVDNFLRNIIERKPTDLIMRLTLAYGCALSSDNCIRDYALEYAKSITNESYESDDAKTNRGWTVVYFGDVNDEDPYTYLDGDKRSWEKAREARIRRFTKKNPRTKDIRFWLFDIPLFHSFLRSRDWKGIYYDEYNTISRLNFSSDYFNEKEIEFLTLEKQMLLKEYNAHLN